MGGEKGYKTGKRHLVFEAANLDMYEKDKRPMIPKNYQLYTIEGGTTMQHEHCKNKPMHW